MLFRIRHYAPCLVPALLILLWPSGRLSAQTAERPAPSGIASVHQVTTTIACGSNVTPAAMKELRASGYASLVSFREPGEAEFDLDALQKASAETGVRVVNIPVNRDAPSAAAADRFLEVIADPSLTPAFLSCRTGERAAMMWLIKRVAQDGWTVDRAMAEAEGIGLQRPVLKEFARQYLASRRP